MKECVRVAHASSRLNSAAALPTRRAPSLLRADVHGLSTVRLLDLA